MDDINTHCQPENTSHYHVLPLSNVWVKITNMNGISWILFRCSEYAFFIPTWWFESGCFQSVVQTKHTHTRVALPGPYFSTYKSFWWTRNVLLIKEIKLIYKVWMVVFIIGGIYVGCCLWNIHGFMAIVLILCQVSFHQQKGFFLCHTVMEINHSWSQTDYWYVKLGL